MPDTTEPKPKYPDTVTLGEWTIPLRAKGGASATYGIVNLGADSQTTILGYAAALGLMWENTVGHPRWPLRCQYKRMGRKWADYGAAVIDGLDAKGVDMGEIIAAGALAWAVMFDESNLWPSEPEVVEAMGK